MNDLGVSLHAHNDHPTFLSATQELNAQAGGLSLNPAYLNQRFAPARDDSPVLGVERTVPSFASGTLAACASNGTGFTGSLAEYAELAKTRLKEHLRDHYDPTRPTLVSHSSGYDSRILSSCLAELRDEGFDLGTIHFRCREPEGDAFLQVMARQGWAPDEFSVFEAPADDPFDVGAWDRPGTSPWLPVTSQINYWRDIVPYDEEQDWNLLGGSGGGEAVEYPSQPKRPIVDWQFCSNPALQLWFSYFMDGTDFIGDVEARFAKVLFPFFGSGHVLTIGALPTSFLGFGPHGCDNVRAAILETFRDSTLDIPRAPRTYAWSISESRWAAMHDSYASSVFVREVPAAPLAEELIADMRAQFFRGGRAERLWRLAALWEVVRG
jgi:hypothetical protein